MCSGTEGHTFSCFLPEGGHSWRPCCLLWSLEEFVEGHIFLAVLSVEKDTAGGCVLLSGTDDHRFGLVLRVIIGGVKKREERRKSGGRGGEGKKGWGDGRRWSDTMTNCCSVLFSKISNLFLPFLS